METMTPFRIVRLTGKDTEQTSHVANTAILQHDAVFTEEEKKEKLSPQKYARAFKNPLGFFYGAFEGERLVGFCGGGFLKNPNAGGALITEVFVLPEYQRRGIGRDLLAVLEPLLLAQKDRIWVEAVRAELAFYLKMGYTVKENVPHFNPHIVVVEKRRPS